MNKLTDESSADYVTTKPPPPSLGVTSPVKTMINRRHALDNNTATTATYAKYARQPQNHAHNITNNNTNNNNNYYYANNNNNTGTSCISSCNNNTNNNTAPPTSSNTARLLVGRRTLRSSLLTAVTVANEDDLPTDTLRADMFSTTGHCSRRSYDDSIVTTAATATGAAGRGVKTPHVAGATVPTLPDITKKTAFKDNT